MRVGIAAAVLLAGCTGSTDPREAGLADNIRNLITGEYSDQVDALDAQIVSETQSGNEIRTALAGDELSRAQNTRTLARLRQDLAALQQDIANAKSALAADDARQSELSRLSEQAMTLGSSIDEGVAVADASTRLDGIRRSLQAMGL